MSRKVTYARFHQNLYVPGAGELGTVFPPNTKTLENLSMTAEKEGLYISFIYKALKTELLIPLANVSIMTLALLEEKVSTKSTK